MSRYYIRRFFGKILTQLSFLDHLTSSTKSLLIENKEIEIFENEKIAIYTVFQGFHNDSWEKNLFIELRKAKFRIITVINTNDIKVKNEAVPGDISVVLRRKNRGYDLAGVRDCVNLFRVFPQELLLINSSVAWHKSGFSNLLNRSKDFAGVITAVNSLQKREHIQSFYFHATTKESVAEMTKVYTEMRNWRTKRATVNFGEIPILQKLSVVNIKVKVLFTYKELIAKFIENHPEFKLRRKQELNPSVNLWRELIEIGFPGVKRNIFKISGNRRFLNGAKSIEDALKSIDYV